MPHSSRSPARYGVRRPSTSYISSPLSHHLDADAFPPVTAFIPQRITFDSNDQEDQEEDQPAEPPSKHLQGWPRQSLILGQTRTAWKRSKRRKTAFKSWEGKEYVLQLVHSLVLLVHSTLHVPPPKTGLQYLTNPGSSILTKTVPRSVRALTLQRIYTAAEGLASVRRVVLLARLIQAGTEAVMERMSAKPARPSPIPSVSAADEKEGFRWLQPQSLAPFDQGASQSTAQAVSSWRETWEEKLSFACNALFTLGEACHVGAFLAASGLFWRSVGLYKLGYVSSRRRKVIERLGIVLPLCGVFLSLLLLRLQRLRLRSEIRSAHRRIIHANDRIGWASKLSGRRIPTSSAMSASQTLPDEDLQDDDQDLSHSERTQEPITAESWLQSTEYFLLGAESDLSRSRRDLKWTFWEKMALWSDGLFLTYETIFPHTDKEGLEAWTGIISSITRLSRVWSEMRWTPSSGSSAWLD